MEAFLNDANTQVPTAGITDHTHVSFMCRNRTTPLSCTDNIDVEMAPEGRDNADIGSMLQYQYESSHPAPS